MTSSERYYPQKGAILSPALPYPFPNHKLLSLPNHFSITPKIHTNILHIPNPISHIPNPTPTPKTQFYTVKPRKVLNVGKLNDVKDSLLIPTSQRDAPRSTPTSVTVS